MDGTWQQVWGVSARQYACKHVPNGVRGHFDERLPVITSTDLFEGPQYRICGRWFSSPLGGRSWFCLLKKYTRCAPVIVFPVPSIYNGQLMIG